MRNAKTHPVATLLVCAVAAPAAAAAADPSCLNPMPVSEVADASGGPDGLGANGLTVSRGDTAEPFKTTVLGVVEDGIAPGVDMPQVVTGGVSAPVVVEGGE